MAVPRVCNNVNIPIIIKQIRDKRNLSQARLAQKLELSSKTINAYEAGRIKPSLDVFLKILNVGGYSLTLIEDIYKTPKELSISASEE
jgi:DNA-binding XRE family transcriptional regulator